MRDQKKRAFTANGQMTKIAVAAALTMAVGTNAVLAQPQESRMFGQGAPFTAEELPPGQLRSALESLPRQGKAKAMHWLHQFSFHEEDVPFLRVDAEGGVFYADTELPEPVAEAEEPVLQLPDIAEVTAGEVFSLHSKPGAPNVVHVNFQGYVVSGSAWNNASGYATHNMPPFDQDNNVGSFSAPEIGSMAAIWHRIAEDLAPFDIDVTTEAPTGGYGPYVGHILVTNRIDSNGNPIYANSAGGVAYVGVWGQNNYTYYQPALVFYNHLAKYAPYIAEASTHELGHNLSMSHDAAPGVGYYDGHGSGSTSWAPIMGVGYYNNVTQWSKGEYTDATNTEDDIQRITGRLGLSLDDHADEVLQDATPLVVEADGTVGVTDPEVDPFNAIPYNKGVIETRTDADLFSFDAGSGQVTLDVTPAWLSWYVDNHRGANLDVEATLYDAAGNLIVAVDPSNETDAQISASVSAGRYYLSVTGVGNATSNGNYSDYGSLGMYFISGSVPVAAPDATPPTPDPMTWANAPVANGSSSISMTATTATDDRSGVEYLFHCVSGGRGCADSVWQSSPSYTASGLAASASYSFQVKARDLAGNETAYSTAASATTAAPNAAPSAAFSESCVLRDCDFADKSSDSDGTLVYWSWNFGDGANSSAQNPSHSYAQDGSYAVTLTVTDDEGSTDVATKIVSITGPQPPAVPGTPTVTDGTDGTAVIAWQDSSDSETGFELERQFLHKNGTPKGATILGSRVAGDASLGEKETDSDATGTGTFQYRVRALGDGGPSAWSGWSAWVTVTDAGGGSGGGGGGDKPCRGKACR